MISPDHLERPFPGMEGAVSESERRHSQEALNSHFETLNDSLRSYGQDPFTGIAAQESGTKKFVQCSFYEGYDVITIWDLDEKGKTTNGATVFTRDVDSENFDKVVASGFQNLREGILPTARSYDENEESRPLNYLLGIIDGLTESIISQDVSQLDPIKAWNKMQIINSGNVSFLSIYSDWD